MRGRKPKPTAFKLLTGNPGKRRINGAEPDLPSVDPFTSVPSVLKDDRASAEWRRLAPMLSASKVLTEGDRASLIALCQQWSRYLDATEKAEAAGLIVKAPSGYPMPNPYLGVANKALAHCTKLWAELGLTPSSRARVTTSGAGVQQSKADRFRQAKRA